MSRHIDSTGGRIDLRIASVLLSSVGTALLPHFTPVLRFGTLVTQYQWIKAVHVIAVFAWWAGLIYIFRLYVYHHKNRRVAATAAALEEMERKLLRLITLPAGIVAASAGILMLLIVPELLGQTWLLVKLGAVLVLIAYHGLAIHTHRRFARGDYYLSEPACRAINEVPTLVLVVVVIMVIVRPAW